jgi:glycerol uptake facilitator-like aquaporin
MAASMPIKLFSEFIGTAALVLSVMASGGNFLIVGATFAVLIFLLGGISSANLNPAISAAMYYSGSLNGANFLLYSIIQLLGGFAAAWAYSVVA